MQTEPAEAQHSVRIPTLEAVASAAKRSVTETTQSLNASSNALLEQQTAELGETKALLSRANLRLQSNHVAVSEAFASLLSQRLPRSRQTNPKVTELVERFCGLRDMSSKMRLDIHIAASLYNLGKLTWRDEMIALPFDKLDKAQIEQYRHYPCIGEELVASLEPVRGAAQLVHHHQERWDGHGYPDRLAGDAIPWGARLLKLAVDFIELQMGMILSRPLSEEETLENMTLNRGAIYDPTLFDEFVVFLSADQSGCEPADDPTTEVTSILLMPGMIIAKNLYSEEGTLLLGKGKLITERLIEKLRNFENNAGVRYTFHVRPPQPDLPS